jgi:hypothetical protein
MTQSTRHPLDWPHFFLSFELSNLELPKKRRLTGTLAPGNQCSQNLLPSVVSLRVREEVQVSGDLMTAGNAKLTRYNLDGTFNSEAPCGVSNAVGIRLRAEVPSCP